MSQYEILDQASHRQVKIKSGHSAELGDALMYVMTFPLEFRDIQSCYPILFTKDPDTGGFYAAALLGLEPEQNLFLKDGEWDATYIPILVQRQPFLIAKRAEGDNRPPVVSLNPAHPRVSEEDGDALFDDEGKPTEYLDQKINVLDRLHNGMQHGNGFIDTLLKHELLEQIAMDFAFSDGEKKVLQGFYCIAEERLYSLKGDVLESLNQAGYLQPIFMAVASLSRIRDLIERRNRL